ncbi:TerB family tellurite resistance protein [bacterium]|nr:TerB family tellurite resistance protein [candidate division CSSED10-310 bacterium]
MKTFLKKILSDLQAVPRGDDLQEHQYTTALAASVILLEVASSDREIATTEQEHIVSILRDHFALSTDDVRELLEAARDARENAVDVYQFTRVINEACTRDEKRVLMDGIWKVIYADGRLDEHEDHLAHQLTRLLHLDHRDMIDAKLKHRHSR